jgi:hypothetical protein
MRAYQILITGLLTGFLAPQALAQQTDQASETAELRERLEAQAERLEELEKSADDNQALEERLSEQKERIDELKADRFDTPESSGDGRVDISGFVNAGFQSTNLDDDGPGNTGPAYRQTDDEVRASNFTSVGVRMDAALTDQLGGTVQLLGLGDQGFDAEVEWGYLSYNFSPAVEIRAGRMVLPFYMNSQSFYLGYAHPWIEPPAEVYSTAPLRAFEGADITWQFNTGAVAHSLNYFFGSTDVDSQFQNLRGETIPYRIHNSNGINLSSSLKSLKTWVAYSSGDVALNLNNAPDPFTPAPTLSDHTIDNDDAYFGSIGFDYDNGELMVMAEHVELNIKEDWVPKSRAHYVTLGYHFGTWTPHLTWANSEDVTFDQVDGDSSGEALYNQTKVHQKSWTLGLRHDPAPGLAVKAEVSTFYDIGASDDNGANDAGLFSGPLPADEDDPLVFRLAANLAF